MAEWEKWSTEAARKSRADHPAGLPSLVILAQRGRPYEILAALEAEMERRAVAALAGRRVEKREGAG